MNEELIKTVSEGNKLLNHSRYRDILGLLVDSFDLVVTHENGSTTHYPLVPPMKVRNYTRDQDMTDIANDYTSEEMLEILRNNP